MLVRGPTRVYRRGSDSHSVPPGRFALRKYLGPGVATVAAAILAFFTFFPLLPENLAASAKALSVAAILVVSVAIGLGSNALSFGEARRREREKSQAVAFAHSLSQRLTPLIQTLLEEQLEVWTTRVRDLTGDSRLQSYVFIKFGNRYCIIATTASSSGVRTVAFAEDEGVVGWSFRHNIQIVTAINGVAGAVYDRKANRLGEQKQLSTENASKTDPDLKWVVACPILDQVPGAPAYQVVGVLSIDFFHATAEPHLNSTEFWARVEALAAIMAPSLAVYSEVNRIRFDHAPVAAAGTSASHPPATPVSASPKP